MKKAIGGLFLLLALGLLLSGCTQQSEKSKETNVKLTNTDGNQQITGSPKETLQKYLDNLNYSNFDERIKAEEQGEELTIGVVNQSFKSGAGLARKLKGLYETLFQNSKQECTRVYSLKDCEEAFGIAERDILNLAKSKVGVIDIVEKSKTGSEAVFGVLRINFPDANTVKYEYYLKTDEQQWKIYDIKYPDGSKLSETITESLKADENQYVTLAENLNKIITNINKVQNDKCSYVLNAKYDFETQRQSELANCYKIKYSDSATAAKDEKICEEISDAYYYGSCYASAAFAKKTYAVCENLNDQEYEATGYLEKLSSKQICYSEYLFKARYEITEADRIQICNKITNTKYKQDITAQLLQMNAKGC